MSLVFVDCEAFGGSPVTGRLTEFGAVEYKSRKSFHAVIIEATPNPDNPAIPIRVEMTDYAYDQKSYSVFVEFEKWLKQFGQRVVFVSDNPAFDFQWINCGFWKALGRNPFGHSGRRISDFYAGLCGDFYNTQKWKRFRVTTHDHNPVHDALGNVEAFQTIMSGKL